MQEVGRLREITFRDVGAGFGTKVDIDHYDTEEYPCRQLIVWDPVNKEIIGGYRFNIFYDLKNKELKCSITLSQSKEIKNSLFIKVRSEYSFDENIVGFSEGTLIIPKN